MEGKKTAVKTISPTIIFGCVLLVMMGFVYLRFPYVHPNRQYTRELYLYGNIIACVIFLLSLIFSFRKKFCRENLIALLFLILGLVSISLQLILDRFRLDTHLGGKIVLVTAAISGVLAVMSAFLGFFLGRSIHDSLLSLGVFFLLCVNLVLPEFTPRHGYKEQLCGARLRGLCIAFEIYTNDYGNLPSSAKWCDIVVQECDVQRKNMCCSYVKSDLCSYAMNEAIPADAEELPGDLVLLFESVPGWNQVGGADDVVTDRHDRPGANIAFADGHVEFVDAEDIPNLRWTVDKSVERQ